MSTLTKTFAAAALISGVAAGAQAAITNAELNNPSINDEQMLVVNSDPNAPAILDSSTSYDVNGEPVFKQRTGVEVMASADTGMDPFATTDINGNLLPSGR